MMGRIKANKPRGNTRNDNNRTGASRWAVRDAEQRDIERICAIMPEAVGLLGGRQ